MGLDLRRGLEIKAMIMTVNPASKGFSSLPLPSFLGRSLVRPLVFVASLANLAVVVAAMRLFGRLVYDIAVPGAVEEEWMGGRRAGGEWPLTRGRRTEDEATEGKERD